ncbi:hypothetical protein K501DRAFT_245704 [Backusella circina FSU 941]|nr:hypothetical protein K501DRAFT_245704 [Backusella circina FSU 941]
MTSLLSLQQHNPTRKVSHSLRTIPITIDMTTQPDMLSHTNKTQRRSVAVKRPLANRLAYVDALVDANALVIESIWMSATPHYTTKAAVVPLRTFIQEVLKRSRTTYSTLQTALFYLFRSRPEILNHLQRMQAASFSSNNNEKWEDAYISCGRRMFLASLVLASKFVQDKTYRNSAWAKIAGLPVAEVNAAERIFLELIGYRLYISQPMFEQWHHLLHMHVERKTQNQPTNLLDLACLPFASTTTTTTGNSGGIMNQQQQQHPYYQHSRSTQPSQSTGWTAVLSPTTFLPPQLVSLKKQDCECQSDTVGRKRRHQEYLMPSPPLSCNSSSPAHPPPVLSTSLPSSSSSSPMHTPTQISPVRVNHNHHHHWKLMSSPASFDYNRTRYLGEESALKKRKTTLDDSYGYNISHVRQSKRKQSNP